MNKCSTVSLVQFFLLVCVIKKITQISWTCPAFIIYHIMFASHMCTIVEDLHRAVQYYSVIEYFSFLSSLDWQRSGNCWLVWSGLHLIYTHTESINKRARIHFVYLIKFDAVCAICAQILIQNMCQIHSVMYGKFYGKIRVYLNEYTDHIATINTMPIEMWFYSRYKNYSQWKVEIIDIR